MMNEKYQFYRTTTLPVSFFVILNVVPSCILHLLVPTKHAMPFEVYPLNRMLFLHAVFDETAYV
jgi:hypothetical protein